MSGSCCNSCAETNSCCEGGGSESVAEGAEVVDVATRLAVISAQTTASRSIALGDSSSVRVDTLIYNLQQVSTLTYRVQFSVGGEAWSDLVSFARKAIGFASVRVRAFGFKFVRVYVSASGVQNSSAVMAISVVKEGNPPFSISA